MSKGGAAGTYSGNSVASFGYLGFPQRSGFSFYPGGSGLLQPTDGNLYAPRQGHGMPEFSPIPRYEGNGKSPITFNAAAMYKSPSIDDKITGNYTVKRQDAERKRKPYLLAEEMMDYLH